MKPLLIPVAALVILTCVLVSGCTSGSGTTPATTLPTPAPVPVATSAPAPPSVQATASPVAANDASIQPLPSAQNIHLALTKDRPTAEIHLLYEGGAGDIVTKKITLWVYAADGTYTEYVMNSGKKPIPGDEIVAPGTRGGDRCAVFVNSAGTSYRVIDENVYASGEYRT